MYVPNSVYFREVTINLGKFNLFFLAVLLPQKGWEIAVQEWILSPLCLPSQKWSALLVGVNQMR